MLTTFGATFLGVIASFLLWFGGQWWIKRRSDKKALEYMMKEIQEEFQLNIALLHIFQKTTLGMLDNGNIPVYIPNRMRLAVYNYIVSSGEIRLIPSIRKQRLVRYSALICENFNKFVDNTEILLAIFLLKTDGLVWAKYRLERLTEQAEESARRLTEYLEKIKQEDLPEEETTDEESQHS